MRTVILLVLMMLFVSYTPEEKTFCDGWKEGYKAGWCFEIVNCIDPVVPTCPIPEINEKTYKDGYNRGFLKGKEDR